MADVTLTYKGETIAELSESGNKTLKTAGKYCEADILLEYVKAQSGIILPPNMLDGLSWERGYFSNTGGISSSAADSKEMYSPDYIPVEENTDYLIALHLALGPRGYWVGLCTYDENKTFKSRVNPPILDQTAKSGIINFVFSTYHVPNGVKFIRVSLRTFGEADIYFSKSESAFNAIIRDTENIVY